MNTQERQEFATAKTDRIFKTIVANEEDPRFLEAILGACLKEKIKIEDFFLTELPISNIEERVKTVDVLVRTKEKYIHVEVNSKFDTAVKTRNLNFFTVIYHQRTKRGEEYDTKTKMVHVDLNFNESKNDLDRRLYYLKSEEDEKLYSDNLEILTINIARIRKGWYDNVIKNEDDIYLVMLDAKEEELKELGKKNPLVKEFGEKVMELNKTDPFMFGVTAEQDRQMLFNTRLRLATEEASEKAKKQGLEQGLTMTARKMIAREMSNEEIVEITGLSIEKIEEIRKQ